MEPQQYLTFVVIFVVIWKSGAIYLPSENYKYELGQKELPAGSSSAELLRKKSEEALSIGAKDMTFEKKSRKDELAEDAAEQPKDANAYADAKTAQRTESKDASDNSQNWKDNNDRSGLIAINRIIPTFAATSMSPSTPSVTIQAMSSAKTAVHEYTDLAENGKLLSGLFENKSAFDDCEEMAETSEDERAQMSHIDQQKAAVAVAQESTANIVDALLDSGKFAERDSNRLSANHFGGENLADSEKLLEFSTNSKSSAGPSKKDSAPTAGSLFNKEYKRLLLNSSLKNNNNNNGYSNDGYNKENGDDIKKLLGQKEYVFEWTESNLENKDKDLESSEKKEKEDGKEEEEKGQLNKDDGKRFSLTSDEMRSLATNMMDVLIRHDERQREVQRHEEKEQIEFVEHLDSNKTNSNANNDYNNKKHNSNETTKMRTNTTVMSMESVIFRNESSEAILNGKNTTQNVTKNELIEFKKIINESEASWEDVEGKKRKNEELSFLEKIILGIRCARQDCRDTLIPHLSPSTSDDERGSGSDAVEMQKRRPVNVNNWTIMRMKRFRHLLRDDDVMLKQREKRIEEMPNWKSRRGNSKEAPAEAHLSEFDQTSKQKDEALSDSNAQLTLNQAPEFKGQTPLRLKNNNAHKQNNNGNNKSTEFEKKNLLQTNISRVFDVLATCECRITRLQRNFLRRMMYDNVGRVRVVEALRKFIDAKEV